MKLRTLGLLVLLLGVCHSASGQTPPGCEPPATSRVSRGPNIFSEQQEKDLSDAIVEHLEREFKVIDDDELAAYLDSIGSRLAPHLPASGLQFRFVLADLPYPTAFSFPGGRIYLSRKLIAFAQSEDELAGVLAHEMAHVVTRQVAYDVTRMFKEGLGVTQVGDRRDIFEKYHQLIESSARNPRAFEHSERLELEEQMEADRLAVYAVTRAGYAPQAYVHFFDRLALTKGETGSKLSDFFGMTKPESKRLREMLKLTTLLPMNCSGAPATRPAEQFGQWQAAVLGYAGLGRREVLHGVQDRRKLEPALRSDITHLRFSRDGRYLLAQDHASIFVLSREPLGLLFRIDAPDALPAQFTPDSSGVVVHNSALRVERWRIADEKREFVHELVVPEGCLQTALSPDGGILACLDQQFTLALIDVPTGSRFFEKKDFFPSLRGFALLLLLLLRALTEADYINMGFSPDGHFFIASNPDGALALDLSTRRPLSLPGRLKSLLRGGFAFLEGERLAVVNQDQPQKSFVVRFPSGEEVKQISVGNQKMVGATRGDFVFLRPVKDYPVGLFDVAANKIIFAGRKAALDLYDPILVGEMIDGQVVLQHTQSHANLGALPLPSSPLTSLRVIAFSRDLKWLAASTRSRGAVWNLETGHRAFLTRGFNGAFFADDGRLYADFPKYEQTERRIAVFNLASATVEEGPLVSEERAKQYGSVLVSLKPRKEGESTDSNATVEVRDVISGSPLWARHFPKDAPDLMGGEGVLVLSWPVSANTARGAIGSDPRLKAQLAQMKEEEGDYYLEVWEARTGNNLGRLLVETSKGSFRISRAFAVGDWVVLTDTTNRVLVYSLSTGKLHGRVFGSRAALSAASGLLAVENERGVVSLYDLSSMEKRDQYVFSSPVSVAAFTADGSRLKIVTANQTVYSLEVQSRSVQAGSR